MKIQYSIYKRETNSAGGKAKNDAFDIVEKMGFKRNYTPSDIRGVRVVQQIFSSRKLVNADILFMQFPTLNERVQNIIKKKISQVPCSIALIHDLPSIQGMSGAVAEKEIDFLKCFSCLIVHNKKMENYIKNLGYEGQTICLDLFDYLHDVEREIYNKKFSNTISFAGNLKKSSFLLHLEKIGNCHFDLYGIKGALNFDDIKNVHYKGMLPSDEIVYLLSGDYGLIWDGDSLDGCQGVSGEYLKYNNPHKLSLCMAAGKPVITWKGAAIADFVLREKIGIVVDSLSELNGLDLEENYIQYRDNVLNIKKKVAEGYYLQRAINVALNSMEDK